MSKMLLPLLMLPYKAYSTIDSIFSDMDNILSMVPPMHYMILWFLSGFHFNLLISSDKLIPDRQRQREKSDRCTEIKVRESKHAADLEE